MTENNYGFTLIELLIALSILSVVTVIIFSGFRVSVRAWERGERDIGQEQRSRTALNLIDKQLSSIDMNVKTGKNNRPYFLEGDNKSVVFLSAIPLIPGNKYGKAYVRYQIQKTDDNKETLFIYEKSTALSDITDMTIDEKERETLIFGAQSISFEYIGRKDIDEERGWKSVWNSEIEKTFPLAVKIIYKNQSDSDAVTVIARLQKMAINES